MTVIERLDNEPLESFESLQYYYKAGIGRTIYKAYQNFCSDHDIEFDNGEMQMWMEFAETYEWPKRVKDRDTLDSKAEAKYTASDQLNDLVKFRKRQSRLSIHLADTTELLLQKAQEALLHLDPLTISAGTLPKYIEAAARISTLAQNAEAQVLALTDLLEKLNEDADEFSYGYDEEDEDEIIESLAL